MNVEERTTILLGAGTLAAFLALLVWVLTQIRPSESERIYTVTFRQPIHGLSKSATVTMGGVRIGRVVGLEPRQGPNGFSVVARLSINADAKLAPVFADGVPLIKEIGNPALAEVPGLAEGDLVTAAGPYAGDGLLALEPLRDAAAARAALAGGGAVALRAIRDGQPRVLVFRDASQLRLAFEDTPAGPRLTTVGELARRPHGLSPRDQLVRIGAAGELASVAAAERALLTAAARADSVTLLAIEVERDGERHVVAWSGASGPPLLRFWHTGTRATLIANLVTGIKLVELSGSPPLGPGGPLAGATQLANAADIPADEHDIFAQLTELIRSRVPVLVDRVDVLLARVGESGSRINAILADAHEIVKNGKAWTSPDGHLDRALTDAAELAKGLRAFAEKQTGQDGDLTRITANIQRLTAEDGELAKLTTQLGDEVASLGKTLREIAGKVDQQLEPGGDIAETLANLRKLTGQQPGSLVDRLAKTQAKLEGFVTELQDQVMGDKKLEQMVVSLNHVIAKDLRVALQQLGGAMQSLQQTLTKMQSNPDSLILGTRGKRR